MRCEARAFFFVGNCPYFAKYLLNSKNSTFFSKNSGKKFAYMKKCLYLCTRKTNKNNTTMKKIYISLPITGHEDTYEERLQELVKVADGFARYKKLEDADFCEYDIITPKDVAYGVEDRMKNPKYTDYILACLDAIVDCDIVILGDGWENSKGCCIELHFATNLGICVTDVAMIKLYGWQA